MFRSGMFLHIMDGLLTDAEDFAFGAGRHGTVGAIEAEGSFDAMSVGVLGRAPELDGQSILAGVLRTKSPDGLTRFGEALAHMLPCGVEMADSGFVFVVAEEFGEYFELDGDADLSLSEGVMNFASDAIALGQDGAEFALGAEEAKAESQPNECGGEGEQKQVKPD